MQIPFQRYFLFLPQNILFLQYNRCHPQKEKYLYMDYLYQYPLLSHNPPPFPYCVREYFYHHVHFFFCCKMYRPQCGSCYVPSSYVYFPYSVLFLSCTMVLRLYPQYQENLYHFHLLYFVLCFLRLQFLSFFGYYMQSRNSYSATIYQGELCAFFQLYRFSRYYVYMYVLYPSCPWIYYTYIFYLYILFFYTSYSYVQNYYGFLYFYLQECPYRRTSSYEYFVHEPFHPL
uniref:PDP238L n=1 Tax=African swine fever virus TaxID=10497 RepID=A0A649YJK0_ASF